MTTTLTLHADIPANRELLVTLPMEVPLGAAEVTVVVSSPAGEDARLGELLDPEFFGIWAGRADVDDSVEFAARLRQDAWKRPAQMYLLDTDVLIECLRGQPAAKAWLAAVQSQAFAIPGVAAMELVAGCRNQSEQQAVERFLRRFPILWPEALEFERAYGLMARYYLAFGPGIPDCLIAAMAMARAYTLLTFNLKHFQPIAGLIATAPYTRQFAAREWRG